MLKQLSIDQKPCNISLRSPCLIKIHIDGAARGNPGPAGAGVFIQYDDNKTIKAGIYLGKKTNNQAEYIALAYAIFLVKQKSHLFPNTIDPFFEIYSDSELLVKQMNGLYKVKNETLSLIKKNIETSLQGMQYKIVHVKREFNKEADNLANMAVDNKTPVPKDFKGVIF